MTEFEDVLADGDLDDDSLPLRELQKLLGGVCRDCQTPYRASHAVFSIALGFKNAPRCLECLSRRLERDCTQLQAQLLDYVLRRACYRKAWHEAERLDGADARADMALTARPTPVPAVADQPQAFWDAGDMACGDLVLALRLRLNVLPVGTAISVRATDPAAPEDIPAWCRMCGHTLVSADHPIYVIRRKGA